MAPLHSLTNLRTPARRVQGDGAPAVEELAKFTIPKLKQPGGSTPARVPDSASQQRQTGGQPQSQQRQADSKPRGSNDSVLHPSAEHLSAADARERGSAAQAVQEVSDAAAAHAEAKHKQASVAAPHPAKPDASLSTAAHAAGASRTGLPPAGRRAQGGGTRRLLAPGGPAARRQTSHAPAAAKAALPLSTAKARAAEAPAVQQDQPHTVPTPQLPLVAQQQESAIQLHDAESQAGPCTVEHPNDSSPPECSTPLPVVQQREATCVSSPAARPPAGRQQAPAPVLQPELPAEQCTPAAAHSTPALAEDTPVSRYADAVSDASDGEAAAGGSPDYCPTGERRCTSQDVDSADERLTCLSPIVTRRGRRTSAAVVQRFGDWYNGDDGELDKALQDYNRMREREAAKQEGADAGRTSKAAASRRKSALPVMTETPAGVEASAVEKAGRRAARQRRTTLAPGQDTAAAVAEMSKQLTDMANERLPGKEADRPAKPSAPLRQRLQQSWQGKSYYDRLKEIAEESEEELATPQRRRKSMSGAPAPVSRSASAPDSTVAAGPVAGAERPSAQPEPRCSDLAVTPPAGAGVDEAHGAVHTAPQPTASQAQTQQLQLAKKGVVRRSKAAAVAAPPAAMKAVDVAAPLAAQEPAASVHKQAAPEAEQIAQLQAELQHTQRAMAESDSRHAADVKSITEQLEAARLAAAAAAQTAEVEALDAARRLQAADSEVQALLAKLEATSAASVTAAAADAQARGRADSRAAAKLKEIQAAAEKKAAALQVEREARRAAEARAAEAEAARQADGRSRRAAEKNAKDLEAKLEAQTKRTQEAVAKADAARTALKASSTAIATLEAQLIGLQAAAAAQSASAAALAELAASAVNSGAAARKASVAC